MTAPKIRDRIKELRRVKASDLRANPKNWRRHPKTQATALQAVLAKIGFADALIARETPEGLELIDGHLRKEISGKTKVPVLILDLTAEESDILLATLDPLAAMALTDGVMLAELVKGINDPDLTAIIAGIVESAGVATADAVSAITADQPRLDQKEAHTCPQCGYEF
jgi:hypothetical protein